ncbi:MAG: PBP1A family penicillin-binding protein [Bacteroides sp.]|nr:PBP1A family penicillin-binding protein [Bacteroides sp.]
MKVIKRILKILFLLIMVVVVIGVGLFIFYAKDAPSITKNELQGAGSSKLYTSDGKYLMSLTTEKNDYTPIDQIPKQMQDAVISIEDKRFYSEKFGIDPLRIASSTIANLKTRSVSQGGSTLTQQLIKLTSFSTNASDRNIKRKAQEAWLAMQISQKYSKDQILEFYLNKVYMDYGIYGVGTASHEFYNKPLNELTLSQMALLAGMPNAPSTYDPYIHPKQAEYRRNLVLRAMLDNKKITRQQYDKAITTSVTDGLVKIKNNTDTKKRRIDDPYIKEVINETQRLGYNPYKDNLKITINLDQEAQDKLYELANKKIKFTNKKMQVGSTVLDPETGHVIAIIGGRNLPDVQLGLNRAVQTGRSSGSSIKPILDYAPALEYKDWSTAQILQDTPYYYSGTNIQLHDWDNAYWGNITMRTALEQSRNVPAVRALNVVGLPKARSFTQKLGIDIPKNEGLSVGIGANVSSLQLAGAYGAFATDGVYHQPRFVNKIETADGFIRRFDDEGKRVMKPSTAYMINNMLEGVINEGTGTTAKIKDIYAAGKTGTVKYSNNELEKHPDYAGTPKDSWFVGYTKQFVVSVWTGYDNLSDGKISGVGEQSAMLLYKDMMSYLMQTINSTDWSKPSNVVERQVNGKTELYLKGKAPAAPKKPKKKKNDTDQNINRTQPSSETGTQSSIPRQNQQSGQNSNRVYYYYTTPSQSTQQPQPSEQPQTDQDQNADQQSGQQIYYYYEN